MGFDALDVFYRLRVCPFCGKKLEVHPAARTMSCFLHGDFIIRDERDGSVTVAFRVINL